MTTIERNLENARVDLLDAQTRLLFVRTGIIPHSDVRRAEQLFCAALDRLWEAQCMAGGSY